MKYYNNLGWASDVLSQSARGYLVDFFEEHKKYREENYNLRKVWDKRIDYEDPIQVEMVDRVQLAAETTTRMKLLPCRGGFLCDYVKGSWAQGHTDNIARDKESLEYHKIIPGPLENGDSLMYGGEMYHGVEEVLSGRRLVLITWFKEAL
mgnify:CR=1 FL=1